MHMRTQIVAVLTTALIAVGLGTAPAQSADGPALTTSPAKLRKATECQRPAKLESARGVVLLVHGTGEEKEESWSWSYEPALHADGFATCSVQLPGHALGDFTVSAEYVVAAIRIAYRKAGRPIGVVGYSQGAMLPVWAIKFWPDLPAKVTDIVGLAGPYDGTHLGNELCASGQCAPLAWQLRQGSRHITALRNAPLPDVPVTSVFSRNDEIVRPQPEASTLPGATNVLLQDVCVLDPSEHGMMPGDPVADALALDALTHAGPADPKRIPADTCQQTFIPHGDPTGSYVFLEGVARLVVGLSDPQRWVDQEPPVPAYARPYA